MANRLAQQFIMPADVVYTDVPNTFTGWPQRLTVNNPSNNTSTFIVTNTNSAGQATFEADNDAGVGASLGVFGSAFGAGLSNVASVGASASLCLMTDYNTTTGTDPITFRVGGYDSSNERMRLTSTGALGLGTTTPGAQLTINNTASDVLTPFVRDTFTLQAGHSAGENLSAHAGELGATWVDQLGGPDGINVLGANGMVRLAGAQGGNWWYTQYVASGAPSGPDYTVQADILFPAVLANDCSIALHGRVLDANNFYAAGLTLNPDGSGKVYLSRHFTGGWAPTIASATVTVSPGTTYTLALVMQGTSLSVQLDGVTVLGPVTDTNITAAGQAGFEFWVDTSAGFVPGEGVGPQLDNFSAIQVAPPPALTLTRNGSTKTTLDAEGTLATLGTIAVRPPVPTAAPLLTVQSPAGQSSALTQWQDSTGGVLAKVDASGILSLEQPTGTWASGLRISGPNHTLRLVGDTGAGFSAIDLVSDGTGHLFVGGAATTSITDVFGTQGCIWSGSSAGTNFLQTLQGQLVVRSPYAGTVGAIIAGASGQTGDLFQTQASDGTIRAGVGAGDHPVNPQTGAPFGRLYSTVPQSGYALGALAGPSGLNSGYDVQGGVWVGTGSGIELGTDSPHAMSLFTHATEHLTINQFGNIGLSSANSLTFPTANQDVTVVAGASTSVPLVLKGASGQTADLLDLDGSQSSHTNPASLIFTGLSTLGNAFRIGDGIYDCLQGGNGLCTQLVSYYPLQLWGHSQVSVAHPFQDGVWSAGQPAPSVIVNISEPQDVGLAIKGTTSQAGDLQQWQDSTGAVLGRVFNDSSRGPTITSDNVQANNWGLQFTDGNGLEHFRIQTASSDTIVYQPVYAYAPITITQSTANPALVGVANYNADLVSLTRGGGAGAMISVNQTAGQCTAFSATTTSGAYLQNNPNTIFYGNGAYQHTGAEGLGRGLDLTVTNNVGNTGVLWGALINATANTAGATALGLSVMAASSAGASTVAQFVCGSPTTVGTIVQASVGQTADLQRWEDSTGATLAKIDASGNITAGGGVLNGAPGILSTQGTALAVNKHLSMQASNATWCLSTGTEAIPYLYVGGSGVASQYFWRANWNDTTVPANTLRSASGTAAQVPFAVLGAPAQSGDLTQWINSGNTVLAKIDASGNLTAQGLAISPTTTTTAPAAGAAGAVPSQPTGWATVTIGGQARQVPYW